MLPAFSPALPRAPEWRFPRGQAAAVGGFYGPAHFGPARARRRPERPGAGLHLALGAAAAAKGTQLIITEKPSVAKLVAKALGLKQVGSFSA
eukprot:s3197_g5.t1